MGWVVVVVVEEVLARKEVEQRDVVVR